MLWAVGTLQDSIQTTISQVSRKPITSRVKRTFLSYSTIGIPVTIKEYIDGPWVEVERITNEGVFSNRSYIHSPTVWKNEKSGLVRLEDLDWSPFVNEIVCPEGQVPVSIASGQDFFFVITLSSSKTH